MVSACAQSFTPPFATALPQATPPKREQCAIIPLSIVRAMFGNITRSGILVYCALAAHADQEGHCWPGRARLGEITGLTERQISRATAELEKKGLLRKEYRANGMVDYYLLPVSPETTPPVTAVTPPLSPLSPITNQGTTQKEQRESEPAQATEPQQPPIGAHSDFASHQEQEPLPPKAPVIPLPSKTVLPDDWNLPDDYRAWAEQHRPDLADQMDSIASKFHDFHLSKATRSACWIAEWRRWINRERAVKPPQTAPQATQPASRYAHLDAKETPVCAAVRAATERSEQNRIAMLIKSGIDPATGFPMARPAVAPSTSTVSTPNPSINDQADQSYAARLAALEARIAARKAREAAEEGRG